MAQLLFFIGLWDLVVTGPAALAAHQGKREPGGTFFSTGWLCDAMND
jgi:hypothetical protein